MVFFVCLFCCFLFFVFSSFPLFLFFLYFFFFFCNSDCWICPFYIYSIHVAVRGPNCSFDFCASFCISTMYCEYEINNNLIPARPEKDDLTNALNETSTFSFSHTVAIAFRCLCLVIEVVAFYISNAIRRTCKRACKVWRKCVHDLRRFLPFEAVVYESPNKAALFICNAFYAPGSTSRALSSFVIFAENYTKHKKSPTNTIVSSFSALNST